MLKGYRVGVYEPAIDPGGFQEEFLIEAENIEAAKREGLHQANVQYKALGYDYPTTGLEVWKVEEVEEGT